MQFLNTLFLVAAVAAPAVLAGDECGDWAKLAKYKPAQKYCEKTYPAGWSAYMEKRGDDQYPVCRTVKEHAEYKSWYDELCKLPADKGKVACGCIVGSKPKPGPGPKPTTTADYTKTTSADHYTTTTSAEHYTTTTSSSAAATTTAAAPAKADCIGQGNGYTYTASNGKKLKNECDSYYGANELNTISLTTVKDFNACQEACATTESCVGISFTGADVPQNCYTLKNFDQGTSQFAGYDAAAIV